MTRQRWRSVNGRTAIEFVAGPVHQPPDRPWLPVWQNVVWWAVAIALVLALSCEFGGW